MKISAITACLALLVFCSDAYAEDRSDENALPLLQQSMLFFKEDKDEEARKGFEKCLEYKLSAKHESSVRACLANLYHKTDPEKAFEYLKEARKLDPTNYGVLPALGSHYAHKREYDAAKECLNLYLEKSPDSPNAASVKTMLEQISKTEQESELLKKLNSAISLMKDNKYQDAIAVLEETQKMDHQHKEKEDELLGACYSRQGKYKQAIECYQRTLAANPKQPAIVSALAGCYEGSGDLKKARELLKQYMHMSNKDSEMATAAKDRMPVLKKVMKISGDASATDYFDAVSKPRVNRWSLTKMPLKVYIEPGDSVSNYQKSFESAIPRALDLWCKATDGKVSWTPTNNKEESHIDVLFTADPNAVSRTESHSEAGVCNVATVGRQGAKIYGIKHAGVKLLTTNHEGKGYTQEEMEATVAHEIGHALGMANHSSNPDDTMFFSATKNTKDGLTERDAKTIKFLYAAKVYEDGHIEIEGRDEEKKKD